VRGPLLAGCLVVLLLLSGCTAPKEAEPANPLFGFCPQWAQGPGGQTTGLTWTVNESRQERELATAAETWANHTLDVFRVRIDALNLTGRLEGRAFSAPGENKQLGIRDYRGNQGPQIVPVVVLSAADVGKEFDVLRSSIVHGSSPAQLPLRMQWTLDGSAAEATLEYSVTFNYKVCGAEF
jgi:hypothetical protein